MEQAATLRESRWRLHPALLVLVAALLAGPWAAYTVTRDGMLAQLDQDAQAAAESRALTLDSILDRQRAVATVLAVDQQVIQLLQQGGPDRDFAVSAKMDLLRAETQSDVIYLLDRRGVSVAASNWDLPSSFIGHDYGFRQYFRQAVAQGTGQEYALGTVSGRPGL